MTRQYFYLLQQNVSCKVREKRNDELYNNLYKTNGRNLNYYKRLAETIKVASISSYPGVYKEYTDVKNLSDMAKIVQNNNIIINQFPTIKQSGKTINVKGAISKRGNKYARYILFNCSQMVVKLGASNYPEHPVYIYYQSKKSRRQTLL